jgi:hypothetical protein
VLTVKEDSMVKKHLIVILVLSVGLLFFTSCSKEYRKETKLDRNWGKSFEAAKQNQILNPEAGKNPEPVVGMEGRAAEKIIERHEQSFEDDPKKEVYNVNFGVSKGK